jgi:hypothetical protein
MWLMTRTEALADADREISRLIQDGRGLFYIAELYGVPVRRHSSRWFDSIDDNHLALPAWLQGQPGTLTLGYLQAQLADQLMGERNDDAPTGRVLCLRKTG